MSRQAPILDHAFIEQQRHKLTQLREQLLRAAQAGETEETEIRSQSLGQAHESEDDAQKLALLEIDGTTVERSQQRLARIERSGDPIPRARLEAMPEAIYTVSELKAREPAGGR
jgi:DnaK suppressor protein